MFKKLICLTVLILILCVAGNASADLIARWKFDEGEGTIAADSTGGYDGTLMGDTAWVEGILDGALMFDGDGDYVDCGNDPALNPSDSFSVSYWAYIIDWGSPWGRSMFSKGGDADADGRMGWSVRRHGEETLCFTVAGLTTEGDVGTNILGNTAPPLEEWFHVACVYDVNNMAYIYINGEVDASYAATGTIVNGTGDPSVYIGTRSDGGGTGPDSWSASYFNGMLDDVRYYDHALEADDLGMIMDGGEDKPSPQAARPKPSNGKTEVPMDVLLSWRPGVYADTHDVYFGTVLEDVNNASRDNDPTGSLVSQGQSEPNYNPVDLIEFGQTYYWRVDEINDLEPNSPWKGDIWSFKIVDYLVVDDFEDYNDFAPDRIFDTWIDGWNIEENGATVGYSNPNFSLGEHFVEIDIVNSGEQSMPYFYDNNMRYSEAMRSLDSGRDWTRQGVELFSLRFRGYPPVVGSFVEDPAGIYTMTGSGADIWGETDEFHFAYIELSGTGSIIARVDSVENTHGWAKGGVMIRDSLEADSAHGMMIVSATQGVSFQRRTSAGGDSFATDIADISAPQWVRIGRDISGNITASYSADGSSWIAVDSDRINMSTPMYIGLVVTAHDASQVCEAVFSQVTIADTSDPQWTNQDIGIVSNPSQPMYVAISNSTGEPAVVYHEDPNATVINTWTEWVVPLQDLADLGIDLTDVDNIAIGVGTRGDTSTDGGAGKMYLDDIRLYLPRPEPEPAQ